MSEACFIVMANLLDQGEWQWSLQQICSWHPGTSLYKNLDWSLITSDELHWHTHIASISIQAYQMKWKVRNNIYCWRATFLLLGSAQNYHACIQCRRTSVRRSAWAWEPQQWNAQEHHPIFHKRSLQLHPSTWSRTDSLRISCISQMQSMEEI